MIIFVILLFYFWNKLPSRKAPRCALLQDTTHDILRFIRQNIPEAFAE